MPAAIAPEETSSTWPPARTRAASAPVSAAMRASSIAPSRVVSEEEPILTTVRADPAMSGRAGANVLDCAIGDVIAASIARLGSLDPAD
jgi:hypothetical protein